MDDAGPGSLMSETVKLLWKADQSLPDIATGAKVNYYWLRKFKHGEVVNPSVNTVQRVFEYLHGAPLFPEMVVTEQ